MPPQVRPRPEVNAAREAVRAAVRRLDEALEPLFRHASIQGVHQARATARKIGDTLSAFDVQLPRVKEQAGLLNDAFGDVRDLHVSGVRRGTRLSHATASMRKTMADWERVRPLVDRELAQLVTTESPKKLLHQRLRRLEKRIEELPAKVPARKAHRLRVKVKRAHTAVALVAPNEKRLLKKLKNASALLGKLHDLDAGLDTAGRPRKQLLHDITQAIEKLRSEL